jgi:hypothetical protein
MMTSPTQSNQVNWKIVGTRKAEELLNGEELRERGSTYRSMDITETDG